MNALGRSGTIPSHRPHYRLFNRVNSLASAPAYCETEKHSGEELKGRNEMRALRLEVTYTTEYADLVIQIACVALRFSDGMVGPTVKQTERQTGRQCNQHL